MSIVNLHYCAISFMRESIQLSSDMERGIPHRDKTCLLIQTEETLVTVRPIESVGHHRLYRWTYEE